MSTLEDKAVDRHSDCAGLSLDERWDDPAELRGEIYTAERLTEHAAEIARAQGAPSLAVPAGPLRARIVAARGRIREAYTTLAREAKKHRDSSPAEEWLLDNSHIVEEQLREIEEDLPWGYLIKLPRIGKGPMAGYPRVYGLCLDYLRHTDARVELENLSAYVLRYESVSPLTIGELWAIPIMLRLGLILVVGALAVSEATARERARGDDWADRLLAAGTNPKDVSAVLVELERDEGTLTPSFLVQLIRRLREHETSADSTFEWIAARCTKMHTTPEELTRKQHLRQAADQLSVGNAITAMRAVGAFAWNEFFEATSFVEKILWNDPAAAYRASDESSRDRCRHAVEAISRRCPLDECAVATRALSLAEEGARSHPDDPARAHVAYYLVDEGRRVLEASVHYRLPIGRRLTRALVDHGKAFYFGLLGAGTVGFAALAREHLARRGTHGVELVVLVLLAAMLSSEIAVALVNGLVVAALPPRRLSKLEFVKGIPAEHRTLVVVPALLDSAEGIRALLAALEVRSLANADESLHFGLLTDFSDADEEVRPEDGVLLDAMKSGIEELNARYAGQQQHRFVLFHRRRIHNAAEGKWMGWERKRGKLDELNRLLRRGSGTSFTVVTAPVELLESVRYVLTLDADTELPRDSARKLVATIAHPLNRPRFDPSGKKVIRGYGIIQPRVGTLPTSTRRSRFARIAAGPPGIDPYTTAVSDVYQDLFGEGSYLGKAIYDVDAFARALEGRVPENRLLSHDLFEGLFARTALANDIEVFDEQPAAYSIVARRHHRWVRGDWQLLPWLFPRVPAVGGSKKNDASLVARWKLFDNLRRSLLAPATVALALAGFFAGPGAAKITTALVALVLTAPLYSRLLVAFSRFSSEQRSPSFLGTLWGDLATATVNVLVTTVFLLDQAVVDLDAIGRTLFRLFVSKRNLLEWTTTGQTERLLSRPQPWLGRIALGSMSAVALLVGVAAVAPAALGYAAPFLLLWASAPFADRWLGGSSPAPRGADELSASDREFLERAAERTWTFFETFVTAEDHYLPPDNFQEEPRGVVAHRTSPTNIGLYLLSVVAAHDFGFITLRGMVERVERTLETMSRLEMREGHILNWYDTTTLKPLDPAYVSTVDSGNLAAYLWTLNRACQERCVAALGERSHGQAELHELAPYFELLEHPPAILTTEFTQRWTPLAADLVRAKSLVDISQCVETAIPRLDALRRALPTSSESDDTLAAASEFLTDLRQRLFLAVTTCKDLHRNLMDIGERAVALANGMNFRFLYDEERSLFSIGYNVGNARLDSSYYDLLASEARLASLVAIAKGDVPQRHWFRLGRPRTALSPGRVLLSWSGSMFEYLMPLLVAKSPPSTLLNETCETTVARQQEYGVERGVPWGISESAFNIVDLSMTYQYRAFGVPGLGLKTGLAEDLVIAPYATVLASMVRPADAVKNLRRLARDGLDGKYGFYEAVDYTPTRVPPGRRGVVVKTFMAHHQGMSLVALDNVLNGWPMQRRFHSDRRIMASELLLEERVPTGAPLVEVRSTMIPTPTVSDLDLEMAEHVGLPTEGPVRAHLLGHGELSTLVTASGTGVTTWNGLDANRFREDAALESGGIFVYVRNVANGELWSAGYQPTRREPESYNAAFYADRVEIRRRDGDVETVLEVVVSPERTAEVRRITLTNHGADPVEMEITTYTEVVLATREADLAHRAFGSLFIETEALPDRGAALAKRRPRSSEEPETWLVQVLSPEDSSWSAAELDTSRASFIGRGRTPERPVVFDRPGPLAGNSGIVIDPAIALRRRVTLPGGARARVALATALASKRDAALELVDVYSSPQAITRTFELGWADARVELRHLNISAAQSQRFQRLLSALLFPEQELRGRPNVADIHSHGKGALFAIGVSGDLPILLLRLDDSEFGELCRELLLAQEFWRLNGAAVDFVILNEEPSGYLAPLQDEALGIIRSNSARNSLDVRGGVHVCRADHMSAEDRAILLACTRIALVASRGSLARQLRRGTERRPLPAPALQIKKPIPVRPSSVPRPVLSFDNGFGGFSEDGKEYVLVVGAKKRTPAPWSNVIANAAFGCLVTESGSTYTWSENSQSRRLTPWSNDPVSDPSGEIIYVRDEDDGTVWSPTPMPAGGVHDYRVRHGHGYTKFQHVRGELEHELTVFVDATDPVKMSRLRVTNRGTRERRLRVYGVVEWVLGPVREKARLSVACDWDSTAKALVAMNPFLSKPERRAFFAATAPVVGFTADREEFFGRNGSRARPAATERVALSGRCGSGLDPCAALEVPLRVAPGATMEVSFVLGEGANLEHTRALATKFATPGDVERALAVATTFWNDVLGKIAVKTPDPALDLLLNRCLVHQVLSSRVWGRTAFYQSSGAYGFRDQLQDVLALVHARPEVAREHILRAAARQFVEGDVQHWWHADTGEGIRTRCSDDMLWLPYVTGEYVRATGDAAILDEQVPFLEERALGPDDHDIFSAPPPAAVPASLYDHCVRALVVGATAGPHGLPKMRDGDWNDGMNLVGKGDGGESVWLAWFLAKTLTDFAALAAARNDRTQAEAWTADASRIRRSVEENGWDGEWYMRGYYDDGTPLGSHASEECRIDAIAQSWAAIAGGDAARVGKALQASDRELVRKNDGIMALLAPPFDRGDKDPGYIRGYPPGVRENGGQYTHGVLWTVLAKTLLGDGDGAVALLRLLNPIHHAENERDAIHYAVEPYVVAGDVYAAAGQAGRGGWTWYTGAAGWMYRIAIEHVLGVRREGALLVVDPCILREWTGFEVTYRFGAATFHVVVENPERVCRGVSKMECDGRDVADGRVSLVDDGRVHEVRVVLGKARGERRSGPVPRPVNSAPPRAALPSQRS